MRTSMTHRWRSAAPRRSWPGAGWLRRARPISAGSIPRRSRGCGPRPGRTPANAEELHDALLWLGCLSADEVQAEPEWAGWLAALARDRRVTRLETPQTTVWVAAERLAQFRALWPDALRMPDIGPPADAGAPRVVARRGPDRDRARPPGGAGPGHAGRVGRTARLGAGRDRRSAARRWRSKASPCAAASPRAPTRTNGATGGCSRASTTTRSDACAPRSSRSPRATSCASCSPGST